MKRKSIFFVPIFIFALFWIINFLSCSDNTITQQSTSGGFDSARYKVSKTTVPIGDYSYIIDSSNIFLGDFYNLLYIKDTSFIYLEYGDNFFCRNMGGRNDEIYFVGDSYDNHPGFEKPRLKKWTGMGFQEIPIVDTTNKYYSLLFVYLSSNYGLFTGGNKGNVLRYYNGNFKKYQFDSVFSECQFFQDEQNNLYCWEYKDSSYLGIWVKEWQYFYKYENDSWNFVYSYFSMTDSTKSNRMWPFQVGNEILATGNGGIYKFDGSSYKKIINTNNFKPLLGNGIGGSGSNNFLLLGSEDNYGIFFNWNGNKWSKEYITGIGYIDIKYANNCFIATIPRSIGVYDLLIFKKTKNNE